MRDLRQRGRTRSSLAPRDPSPTNRPSGPRETLLLEVAEGGLDAAVAPARFGLSPAVVGEAIGALNGLWFHRRNHPAFRRWNGTGGHAGRKLFSESSTSRKPRHHRRLCRRRGPQDCQRGAIFQPLRRFWQAPTCRPRWRACHGRHLARPRPGGTALRSAMRTWAPEISRCGTGWAHWSEEGLQMSWTCPPVKSDLRAFDAVALAC